MTSRGGSNFGKKVRRAQRFAGRNTQRATLQTPQGLDATHGDELFPVKREYIGINSGAGRAPPAMV
jgi:hypothetical protein